MELKTPITTRLNLELPWSLEVETWSFAPTHAAA